MARNKTPDSGYQFVCQHCEEDVFQGPPPELVMAIEEMGSGRNRSFITEAYQCCHECAAVLKKENEKFQKKHGLMKPQVRALREETELQSALPAPPPPSAAEVKLDKLIEAISGLTNLMLMKHESEVVAKKLVSPPATTIQVPPNPKRAILAPPVKRNAPSKAKKSAPAKGKVAKPKSRR